jgi:hypothetical protein
LLDGEITTDGSVVVIQMDPADTFVLNGYYSHELRFYQDDEQAAVAVGRMGVKPSIIGGG